MTLTCARIGWPSGSNSVYNYPGILGLGTDNEQKQKWVTLCGELWWEETGGEDVCMFVAVAVPDVG